MSSNGTGHSQSNRRIVWIDCESTSLDATNEKCRLLELGIVVTTMNLEELGSWSSVVWHNPKDLHAADWTPEAARMHMQNGLVWELHSGQSNLLTEVERRSVAFLKAYAGSEDAHLADGHGNGSLHPEAPLWGGSSTWIDRTLVRRCLPEFYARIHYRTLDVSSFRTALEHWGGVEVERGTDRRHRALDDLQATLRDARLTRDTLREHLAKERLCT